MPAGRSAPGAGSVQAGARCAATVLVPSGRPSSSGGAGHAPRQSARRGGGRGGARADRPGVVVRGAAPGRRDRPACVEAVARPRGVPCAPGGAGRGPERRGAHSDRRGPAGAHLGGGPVLAREPRASADRDLHQAKRLPVHHRRDHRARRRGAGETRAAQIRVPCSAAAFGAVAPMAGGAPSRTGNCRLRGFVDAPLWDLRRAARARVWFRGAAGASDGQAGQGHSATVPQQRRVHGPGPGAGGGRRAPPGCVRPGASGLRWRLGRHGSHSPRPCGCAVVAAASRRRLVGPRALAVGCEAAIAAQHPLRPRGAERHRAAERWAPRRRVWQVMTMLVPKWGLHASSWQGRRLTAAAGAPKPVSGACVRSSQASVPGIGVRSVRCRLLPFLALRRPVVGVFHRFRLIGGVWPLRAH
mmetsp:Transcript_59178/g.180464  ORF Transcript_59178/g.180464 Transcript_59178/m.180464 type:complete len:414 (+) Transcript_59178:185-1426(+)